MVPGEFAICETLLAAHPSCFFFSSSFFSRPTGDEGKRKDAHRCFIGCVTQSPRRALHCIPPPTALYLAMIVILHIFLPRITVVTGASSDLDGNHFANTQVLGTTGAVSHDK